MRRYTGDVNDGAFATTGHHRPKFLAWQEDAANEIQIEIGAPILQLDLLKGALGRDRHLRIVATRGIHQNRWCAQDFHDRFMCPAQTMAIESVGAKECRRACGTFDALYPRFATIGV